jgi:hypothetical protein
MDLTALISINGGSRKSRLKCRNRGSRQDDAHLPRALKIFALQFDDHSVQRASVGRAVHLACL